MMESETKQDIQSHGQEKSNQRLTNTDLRNVSLQLDPIERNSLLARVDDQTQTFTAALVNPGATVAETDGSGAFSKSDASDSTTADPAKSPENRKAEKKGGNYSGR